MKRRKVSEKSTYNHRNRRIAKTFLNGKYDADKKEWTGEQLDDLLEQFLFNELPFITGAGRSSLLTVCNRTVGAIKVALWKLAGRYVERKHFGNYKPQQRTDRTSEPWTHRDFALLALSTNESGISRNAHDPKWIGKILGRHPNVVAMEMNNIARRERDRKATFSASLFRATNPTEEQLAKLVHQAVKRYLTKLILEIEELNHGKSNTDDK